MRILTHLAMTMADTHVEVMLLYQNLCCGRGCCSFCCIDVVHYPNVITS
jgi:hypothetical protein